MTLHKAKGLEFDLVIHLDLYEHIIPQYRGDYEQDLNLHYVGITRARKACILCTSTHRHKAAHAEVVSAKSSPFLTRHDVHKFLGELPPVGRAST